MKSRFVAVGLAAAASLFVPQQAQALVQTTAYKQFKIYQNPIYNVGPTGTFANFGSFGIPSATLSGVGFIIAGAEDGTGTATLGGNPFVANGSLFTDKAATVNWAPTFTFNAGASSVMPTASSGTKTPVPCITLQKCPTPGGNLIPASSNRYVNLAGTTYAGTAPAINLTGAAINAFTTGTITTSSASAGFSGSGSDLAYGFDPTPVAGAVERPYIEGWVAIVYDYNLPPAAVPGPLPLMGAAAAFGWSRRLKKRISSAA